MNRFEAIFLTEIFNYVGFFLKNEVEYDFFEGLSTSVISNFVRPPPNLTRIGNPYDFAVAISYAKLAMTGSLNYEICEFERF